MTMSYEQGMNMMSFVILSSAVEIIPKGCVNIKGISSNIVKRKVHILVLTLLLARRVLHKTMGTVLFFRYP